MNAKFSNIDYNQFRALYVLLDEASVTRAASRLAITPAATSNALRRLRDLFEDPLLVRAGQQMVRTSLGESLREPASDFMRAAESIVAIKHASFDLAKWEGTLSLLTSDYVYLALGRNLETLLQKRIPGLNLVVQSVGQDDTGWLRQNEGLAITPSTKASNELRSEPLFHDQMVVTMRADHPLATQAMTLDRYCEADHVLVSVRGRPGSLVDSALEKLCRSRRVARTVSTHLFAAHLVSESDYVTALPERFVEASKEALNLISKPLPLKILSPHFRTIWHKRHEASPVHLAVRGLLKKALLNG